MVTRLIEIAIKSTAETLAWFCLFQLLAFFHEFCLFEALQLFHISKIRLFHMKQSHKGFQANC